MPEPDAAAPGQPLSSERSLTCRLVSGLFRATASGCSETGARLTSAPARVTSGNQVLDAMVAGHDRFFQEFGKVIRAVQAEIDSQSR